MANNDDKNLQQQFLDGEVFVGNEHLIPTNIRQPMPTTAPTPPPPPPAEGDKEK